MTTSNTSFLDLINAISPLDETREDHLLQKTIRETIYNPPEYKARSKPDYETCEYVFTKGMYRGENCHGKRENRVNGTWYCENCVKKIPVNRI